MKKRKFDVNISRFFNPWKSGTKRVLDKLGNVVMEGTHQREKYPESKFYQYIPNKVKNGVIQPHIGSW